jgi:hypothetical protein
MHNMYIFKILLSQRDSICGYLYLYEHYVLYSDSRSNTLDTQLVENSTQTLSLLLSSDTYQYSVQFDSRAVSYFEKKNSCMTLL